MKIYVLAGGPCGGKSTILNELFRRDKGFWFIHEIARYLKEIELKKKIPYEQKILPETKPVEFQTMILKRRKQYIDEMSMEAKESRGVKELFMDTGDIEAIAYCGTNTLTQELADAARAARYDKVFLIEPLPNYVKDAVRTQEKEEALNMHEKIRTAYEAYDYKPIKVPNFSEDKKENVEKRVDFILKKIH